MNETWTKVHVSTGASTPLPSNWKVINHRGETVFWALDPAVIDAILADHMKAKRYGAALRRIANGASPHPGMGGYYLGKLARSALDAEPEQPREEGA